MEALILVAGVAAFIILAASMPFVLLWELLFGDLGLSKKEKERRHRRLIATLEPTSKPSSSSTRP